MELNGFSLSATLLISLKWYGEILPLSPGAKAYHAAEWQGQALCQDREVCIAQPLDGFRE
jgi:hypothetical protein